ncbi:sulfite oxidase-like [Sycon ciliatum]|uniref:sulfite oxidase-like n=1 Tax=Sycon ciliatum TaxID=27933 RepID=UPI0020AB547F|eukprot:scpid50929/ scgid34900/ Sulfite oxidase, mitochondrial
MLRRPSTARLFTRYHRCVSSSQQFQSQQRRSQQVTLAAAVAGGVGLAAYLVLKKQPTSHAASKPIAREFSLQDVAEHNSLDKGVWVTYGENVYDVTSFVESHPGGMDKIMLAAGRDLQVFWSLYAIHQSDEVREILDEYKIGVLDAKSLAAKNKTRERAADDPYAKDPERNPLLTINTEKPFNAETPVALLTDSFITPNELFFVRNHLPVPNVEPKKYVLEVTAPGREPLKLSLQDLKEKFTKHTVVATLQCAGNRRRQMTDVKSVKGLSWGAAAISNAEWSGARLRDVLQYAGLDTSSTGDGRSVKHIQFEGLDQGVDGKAYGASIPVRTAMDQYGDVLLAYEMNGQELPRDHGYPVRAVIPGVVGARNVKWLSRVIASHEESHSHWQRNDYKGFSPGVDWDTVDFTKSPAIQDLPVQSAICVPSSGTKISSDDETLSVKGYAWSGGGRGVVRVDVSIDGGKTWCVANLVTADDGKQDQESRQRWAWALWDVDVAIPEELRGSGQQLDVICKAVDESYNNQPESVEPIWNLRGVLNNSWHHSKVFVR